ncbi:VWA domain-containing protein [Roseomonas sp. M0104]|uniref:VWA domain-containing protein n=1 Tax=Teichococcus coralli TaxID=2545983 RepID=A0A845BBR8_9PROT|nr:VWA domain-containing protein [Pseudoroseomonas coralli]MXP63566.1 VWA domain-containing protein [Pseudoroseomonas coralli]
MTLALDQPWALALLPLPLLAWLLLPAYREPGLALRLPMLARIAGEAGPPQPEAPRPGWLRAALALLAWLLLVLALAAPVRIEPPVTRETGGRDVLLALDLSGSMAAEDMPGSGGMESRLDSARAVLKEFIARREDDRLGLIVFGTSAFVLAPFTRDHAALLALLDEAFPRMAGPQTMIGDAIGLAARTFERAKVTGRLLVLLTDGNDTGSRVPPARAAAIAGNLGVRIYAVSLGDPAAAGEAALDLAALDAIAQATGGAHFHASDPAALAEAYRRIDAMEPTPAQAVSWRPRTPLFAWPLAGFALLAALLLGTGPLAPGRRAA